MNRTLARSNPAEATPFSAFGRVFDDFLVRNWLRFDEADRLIAPSLDIVEDEHAYVVTAELPGLKKEDVQIQLEDGVLSISGEKKQETDVKEKTFHRMERRYGSFYRAVTLPAGVDVEKVDARFEDGVLKIRVPKREEIKPKAIKIQ